jgi:nucleotide-binding universal stress UspA family protein
MMLRVKRVLYATDCSPSAEHAFGHAVRLATALDASLHIVHVVLPDLEDLRERVDPATVAPATPAGIDAPRFIRSGESAAQEIIAHCDEHDIDLVVMGTRGRTGIGRLLLGSVAEQVVREAPCPVLTVPSKSPDDSLSRVLAAVDLSEHSRPILEHALAMAALHGARLDVIHVVQEITVPTAYTPELAPMMTPDLEERAREGLVELVAQVDLGLMERSHVTIGYPATEILRYAEENGVNLIVMATHGLTGIQHFLIGSVTEKVVRRAPCPVLTVRSFGKSIA